MSLLLVPYTNAMRLGQGFNSYTQQICVDDAVVINNDRAENTLLNDGTTMRILIQSQAKASAWTRQKEVVVDDRTIGLAKEPLQLLPEQELDLALEHDLGDEDSKPKQDNKPDNEPPEESDSQGMEDSSSTVMVEAGSTQDTTEDSADEKAEQPDVKANHPVTSKKHPAEGGGRSASVDATRTADKQPSGRHTEGKEVESLSIPTKKPTASAGQHSKPTGWKQLQDSLAARRAAQVKANEEDLEELRRAEKKRLEEQRKHQEEIEKELREEDRVRRAEDREEQRKIRAEKRQFEEERRTEMLKSIKDATSSNGKALTVEQVKGVLKQNQFAERWNSMGENDHDWVFDASSPRGPSQTVTYTSRFVDRLSDITDDMCISGALSIKAAKIGGSGRGSFIDSDKFKNSDLTFYISVKVINQTINFKDALEYKPLRGVNKDNFTKYYGDSFISGFLEGGEFNAVVSMKILNKAKKTDIQAEAKVALTTGPMSVEAEANVGIARENIQSNTETTIQVSWCGGGHIKPLEQQWDIKSLMQAAARFPDLVADCPQRTYAILTKYDNLRSFIIRQPEEYSKLQYENAQIYTNVLMDAFMTYKALSKKLSDQIFQIGNKTMEFIPWEQLDAERSGQQMSSSLTTKNIKDGSDAVVEDKSRFEASIAGLDEARKAIRRQMLRIVNEVDAIEKDPTIATDENHHEPFQTPTTFEARLPTVEVPESLRPKHFPLHGRRIMAQTQTEEERVKELEEQEGVVPLYTDTEEMAPNEAEEFAKIIESEPSLGDHLQVTAAVGGTAENLLAFNTLQFVREDWHIRLIEVGVRCGQIVSLKVEYWNGLIVQKGSSLNGKVFQLGSFQPGERIMSCRIESGVSGSTDRFLLGIRLYTNCGRSMLAEARERKPTGDRSAIIDGFEYKDITFNTIDCPLKGGTLKGFFGRTNKTENCIFRLGLIWGDILREDPSTATTSFDGNRRVLTSKWGQTMRYTLTTYIARFGISYNAIPKVLYGISEVKGLQTAPRPPSWDPAGFNVTADGFTATIAIQSGWGGLLELNHSWLTLPNNEVNFNVGKHDFENEVRDGVENATGTFQVVFEKPYKEIPATPAIWCITLDYSGGHAVKKDARLRARVEDLTTTGFKLIVECWGGGTHAGNEWGWCVWDKQYDGVKVKMGTTSFTNTELKKGNMQCWQPDFGGGIPVSIMTGIRGFDINVSDGGRFHAKSQYQGGLDNGYISWGVDSTASARWMEVMYVAILEN